MDTHQAIADLQIRLTYQEDDLKALNAILTRQQGEIDGLRAEIARLRERMCAMAEPGALASAPEPPPPHY